MRLTNTQLQNFIGRIKLKQEDMPKYRDQINNLRSKLETKIKEDKRTGMKVTKFILAGSWKKGTILKPTGEHPIDVDLVLYVEGDESLKDDLKKLHDFVVQYLEEIYPTKDIKRDVDAEGNTKSIKIKFTGTGLELDIVPVVPMTTPKEYVWQPQRGGGGKRYVTSVTKQLEFSQERKVKNASYTSIVRAIKWWKNYKELKPIDDESGLSSFVIELIVSHLEIEEKVESEIEAGIIRFFRFVSDPNFPVLKFKNAINSVPASFDTPIYAADPTNNENNAAKKLDKTVWKEVISEAKDAFDSLFIAQAKPGEGETIEEWKHVFGPTFNISNEQ
ncbi:MAG: nucleotidyltransferase [Bacteroidetes bacterium]|nr:nucleotidyltransferase [Bacteroidota bacterium]